MKNIFLFLLFVLVSVLEIKAEEVSIVVNGYTLRGTLVLPKSDKPVDVVLIIAGSGPTNRDGNNPISGKNNTYKMLAELFLKEGITSLRYDKRGIGENDAVDQAKLTFEMYINDAVEWIKYLKNDNRIAKVIVAGHSEGSLLGMVAAKITNADKYISLCGAGKPIYRILEEQLILSTKRSDAVLKRFYTIVDSLKRGFFVSYVIKEYEAIFNPSIQPYIISWFKYNPYDEIAKLKIPVLIIGGTTDIQVKTEDAQLLANADKFAKLAIIEDMNHVLKEVATLDPKLNFESYSNPDLPLSDALCKELIEFLKN